MWENEPERVDKATAKIREGFTKSQEFESGKFPGTEAVDFAAEQLAQRYDPEHGGFGTAPKFPSPHNLMFMLRQWKLTGEDRFLEMVTTTLKEMRLGGIWDHIGYGFHRYSTDQEWLLPHFEKMLYDQALLMMAYTEAWQATQNPLFKQTVYEIAEYVERNLHHPEGGFYSAEDADSEGEEGKFYVWEKDEIESVLGNEASAFEELFNITEEGNFEDEASGERTGKNIPHLKSPLDSDQDDWFNTVRANLFDEREERIHPLLDDKILTDWNGLMIAALAKAGFVFNEEQFTGLAENAFSFIEKNLAQDDQLLHRFNDGEAAINAMGDDYAFLIWALIELYEATFKPEYLEKAIDLNQSFIDDFWDEEKGGFYFSIADDDQVYGRQKQIFDGAMPSSNSVAMMNLIRLSRLTGQTKLEDYADKIGRAFSADLIRSGASICQSMQSIQFLNADAKEISLVSNSLEAPESARTGFNPFRVLHIISDENKESLAEIASYISTQKIIDGQPTLYVCTNFMCDKPVNEQKKVEKALGQ
jgi:uncharacterized protein YyaL (SSP411 family)